MNTENEEPSELLIVKIRHTFPSENPADVLEILELYGADSGEREVERVRLAALKSCAGNLSELHDAVCAAKEDYRDVLAWAESPNQMRAAAELAAMPIGEADEIRDRDRRQYLAWLADEK